MQYLGPAARQGVQAGGLEAAQHRGHAQAEFLRPEKNFRRGKGVDVQLRPVGAQPTQQVFVPLQGQIGVVTALKQNLRAAQAQGFFHFLRLPPGVT